MIKSPLIYVLTLNKSLKNNLEALRNKLLSFAPDPASENFIQDVPKDIADITDLFFFNEFTIDDASREVMVVELKSPICRISKKELAQIDEYSYQIERGGVFPRNLRYKIILVSSEMTGFAKSQIGQFPENPFLYRKSKDKNIECYVYTWSEIINISRRKLSFLDNSLKTRDREIREIYETDFKDLNLVEISSKLSKPRIKG